MKLLVVCQYYYPEQFQINDICERLSRDGYEITVLTGLPNYPAGAVPREYRFGRKRDETRNGVRILRTFEIGRRKGPLFLALNYLSFCLSASIRALRLRESFDAVLIYQLSPVLMAIPGLLYKKKRRVPALLYCCDLWPESMKLMLKNERALAFRAMRAVSRSVYRACDRIAVQSKGYVEYLASYHGVDSEKIAILPQFADDALLTRDFTPHNAETNFVFLGNVGIAQNLERVLEAAARIKDTDAFRVHIVGEGACLEALRRFAAERDLDDRVIFHGRRPVEEMERFYALADACLLPLKSDNRTGEAIPSKLQGYLAAGKPVIGMIDGPAAEVIQEAEAGVCVPADDAVALAEAMRGFIRNPERYRLCGVRARAYYKAHFSREAFMEALKAQLSALCPDGNEAR